MKFSYLIIAFALTFLMFTAEKCMPAKDGTTSKGHVEPIEATASDEHTDPVKFEFVGDYPERWKKVDSLNNLGLYKSALAEVGAIYDLARKDKNYPQVIKAQMHKLKYNTYLTDDD